MPPGSALEPEAKKVKARPGRKKRDPLVATKRDFAGKEKTTTHQDIKWVYENMAVSDVRPKDAPSAGAWGLWLKCQDPEFACSVFYRTLLPKTIPTQAAIDKASVNDFQDTRVDGMAQRLLNLRAAAELEAAQPAGGVQ